MSIPWQWLLVFYVANQVASAFVQALPPPNGNMWYNFMYKFLNLLVADFKTFGDTLPKPVITSSTTTGSIVTTSKAAPSQS